MGINRFDIFFEKHFGLGVRWQVMNSVLMLSIAIPFVTIVIAIGRLSAEESFERIKSDIEDYRERNSGDHIDTPKKKRGA